MVYFYAFCCIVYKKCYLSISIFSYRPQWIAQYQHDKVMVAFSKRFPDVLFTLTGEGEESADIWKTYYKGGKIQVAFAEITIPEFDESKLEEYKDE